MLFNIFTTTALAASSLLAVPVLSNPIDTVPHSLEPRGSDITVKYWDSLKCKTSVSKREYNSGHCVKDLASYDVAVSMQSRKSSKCYMIRFKKTNCQGESVRLNNLDDCYQSSGPWRSLKFVCPK